MEIDLKLCNFAAEKASLLGACPQQGVGMKVKNKPWHSLNYTPEFGVTRYHANKVLNDLCEEPAARMYATKEGPITLYRLWKKE